MENKNQIKELTEEISNLHMEIHELKNAIEGVAGELFMLVKVLQEKK